MERERKASRLPMRNWNYMSSIISSGKFPLPDYLWGIETSGGAKPLEDCTSFQTTYEELKLEVRAGVTVYAKGFQTTYEELKLLERNQHNFIPCFQTTYEELKHNGKHRLYRSFGTASRLPMRNWNKYFSVPSGFLAGFQTTYEELKLPPPSVNSHTFPQLPDYLWGIETLAVGFLVVVAMVLPDYLWGIETRKRRNHCRQFGFQTTYEELKL